MPCRTQVSTHHATLANVIAHRIRICSADFMFAKLKPEDREEFMHRYPYDQKNTVVHMSYVYDKQLYRAQLSRRLQTLGVSGV